MAGVAPSRNVVDSVGERLNDRLTPDDFKTNISGESVGETEPNSRGYNWSNVAHCGGMRLEELG